MTAPLSIPSQHSAISSSPLPSTQSTATILEYRCLYTADLRRKQKRWQDGRLKFHTFNKRVMVHDERGNFVGDTHWVQDYDFDEGEELELERGGVIVQVADCVGRKDQDLSDLLDKRAKEKQARASLRSIRPSLRGTPGSTTREDRHAAPAVVPQLRNSSSKIMPETPLGRIGRAMLPHVSPYDERQRTLDEHKIDRPSKRRKLGSPDSRNGYAQSLTGATLSLSSRPTSSAPLRLGPLWAHTTKSRNVESIDMTSDKAANAGTVTVAPSMKPQGQKLQRSSTFKGHTLNTSGKQGRVIDSITPCKISAPALISQNNSLLKTHQGVLTNDGGDDEFIDIDTLVNTQRSVVQVSLSLRSDTSEKQRGVQCESVPRTSRPGAQELALLSTSGRQLKKSSDQIGPPHQEPPRPTGVGAKVGQMESCSKYVHCNFPHEVSIENDGRPQNPLRIKSRPRREKLMFISRSVYVQESVGNRVTQSVRPAGLHLVAECSASSRDTEPLCAFDQAPGKDSDLFTEILEDDVAGREGSALAVVERDAHTIDSCSIETPKLLIDGTLPREVTILEHPLKGEIPHDPPDSKYDGKHSISPSSQNPILTESGELMGHANVTGTCGALQRQQADEKTQSGQLDISSKTVDLPAPGNDVSRIEANRIGSLHLERQTISNVLSSNPATRGRKAAQQKNSMLVMTRITEQPGFQSIIRSEAPPPIPAQVTTRHRFDAPLQNGHSAAFQLTVATAEDMGPWSREASDLLDWKKPSAIAGNQ